MIKEGYINKIQKDIKGKKYLLLSQYLTDEINRK